MNNQHIYHMTSNQIMVTYNGLESNEGKMDMRSLGRSYIGIERAISKGLMLVETGEYPHRGQAMPFIVRTTVPRSGSFEVFVFLETGPAFLPFIHDVFQARSQDIVGSWLKALISKFSGQEDKAHAHLKDMLEFLDKVDERRHEEIMASIESKSVRDLVDFVYPVGKSSETISLNGYEAVDYPIAEAIRSHGKIKIGDRERIRVRVDGFTRHNRQLKVELPENTGRYITGVVRDPIFDNEDSIYLRAAVEGLSLDVEAKIARRLDGTIQKVYILDADMPDENRFE